ncbi:MAG TPA: LLM class flavin-dependent oxidoreductase [Thermoanaerobaculia bacterium]|nr:LLM class flavin-dependent oxidoreductase [Thermoanaerobaculia bacterium]
MLAAGGPQAASLAAECCDGLITTSADREVVEAFRNGDGRDSGRSNGGPCYAEVSLSWAKTREEAIDTAFEYNRWGGLGWDVMPELPDPEAFASVAERTTREQIAENAPCGPDPEPLLEEIQEHLDAGFDHIVLRQIGPEQSGFLDFFERELRPRLEKMG